MSRRVLISDPMATNRIALKTALSSARYEVQTVAFASEALRMISRGHADLVLVSSSLPDMEPDAFCREVAQIRNTPPAVVMMVDPTSCISREELLSAGTAEVLIRPLDRTWLLTNLRSILRRRETEAELRRRETVAIRLGFGTTVPEPNDTTTIGLVAQNPRMATHFREGLTLREGIRIETMPPSEALGAAGSVTPPALFVLCLDGQTDDDGDVFWLLSELRAMAHTRHTPVLVDFRAENFRNAARALDLGADDLVPRAVDPAERVLRIMRLIERKREADRMRQLLDTGLHMAARDELTGLWTRRYALRHLEELAARPHANGRGFATIIADVDRFKSINDATGHATGDMVLRWIAERMGANLRVVDLVSRFGGEEFLILLPDTAPDEALRTAERLRRAVCGYPVRLEDGAEIPVSISLGVCCEPGKTPSEALDLADRALYDAKRAGRNCVRLASVPGRKLDYGAAC